ncbi:hypothetical protein LMH87_009437 [Akanthomyces muscarius]|uniref:Uncharacterized protein n=1 Tax=Akanthomyces muscarius TaxID=2231603 RepID=A0A9W8UJJ2_AKAMU|nr:hypothetical protein LMH87_009437 [Akanthomyces muscarius]KAJ4152919.1 hypothetical protein LMH87_009437 [Akanthomyces muscarius]
MEHRVPSSHPNHLESCSATYNDPASPPSLKSRVRINRKPVAPSHNILPGDAKQNHAKQYIALSPTDTDDSGPGSGSKAQRKPGVLSLWKWESLSILASVTSFISIVVVLRVYQDQLLADWKIPIPINAVVAILSSLFKGSLALPVTEGISQLKWLWFSRQSRSLVDLDTYDKASRGPWGATVMLLKQFQRAGSMDLLASFGALLVLTALVVDPFSQATVALKPCWREADQEAAIPRANNYNAFGRAYSPGGVFTLDAPMALAAYMGVLHPPANSSVSVPVTCSTRNCTFASDHGATFTTLGMCTLVWDISDEVKAGFGLSNWNYSIPYNATLSPGRLMDTNWIQVPINSFPAGIKEHEGFNSIRDVQLIAIGFADPSCKKMSCSPWPEDLVVVAFIFSFIPCVQTFAASFTDGVYWEKKLDEQFLLSAERDTNYSLALNGSFHGDGKWKLCTGTENKTDTNTVAWYNPSAESDMDSGESPHVTWYPHECVYTMGWAAASALSQFIGPIKLFEQGRLETDEKDGLYGDVWLQRLWNNGHMSVDSVSKFAEGMALAISTQMRTNPSDSDSLRQQRGTAWKTETCITVKWKYLSFLATLLLLEMLFFFMVIVANHRSSWGAGWKSSTLAVAFQNVGSTFDCQDCARPSTELSEDLHEAAAHVQVAFTAVDGRWQLKRESGYGAEDHAYAARRRCSAGSSGHASQEPRV